MRFPTPWVQEPQKPLARKPLSRQQISVAMHSANRRVVTVLADHEEGDRRVRVIELKKDRSRLYFEDGALYTHIDPQGDSLLAYVTAMLDALKGAQTVLVLGTAGGALATQLSRTGASVTAVDNFPTAFELAREWFHLPLSVECIADDAIAFLTSTNRTWDALAIDVYSGTDLPSAFLKNEVGVRLRNALNPGGRIVWNVADLQDSNLVLDVVSMLRHAGFSSNVRGVLQWDVGNSLVVAELQTSEILNASRDGPNK